MAEKKEKQYVSDNARLMAEWNWEKNTELGFYPDKLTCGSGKKACWICSNGHKWEARINSRSRGRNCPKCNKEYGTSFPEQAIYYYLSLYFNCENRYNYNGFEIDIFLPDQKIAIEYDGEYFHSSVKRKNRDIEKSSYLEKEKIRLIIVFAIIIITLILKKCSST